MKKKVNWTHDSMLICAQKKSEFFDFLNLFFCRPLLVAAVVWLVHQMWLCWLSKALRVNTSVFVHLCVCVYVHNERYILQDNKS